MWKQKKYLIKYNNLEGGVFRTKKQNCDDINFFFMELLLILDSDYTIEIINELYNKYHILFDDVLRVNLYPQITSLI